MAGETIATSRDEATVVVYVPPESGWSRAWHWLSAHPSLLPVALSVVMAVVFALTVPNFADVRNLLKPFPERNMFDVVFCRNVAIYFKPEQRADMFNRITGTMAPGGWLFVGSAERLSDLGSQFTPETHCNCTVYRPKPLS